MSKGAMFIDGANLFHTSERMGFRIDFQEFKSFFRRNFDVRRFLFYTAIVETNEFKSIKPLVDHLSYNGYVVVSKVAKTYINEGERKIKGNMDIEMATDIMLLSETYDRLFLLTGDGDFRRVVEEVQRKGAEVTAISTLHPPMIADELRRQADEFIDLADYRTIFGRG